MCGSLGRARRATLPPERPARARCRAPPPRWRPARSPSAPRAPLATTLLARPRGRARFPRGTLSRHDSRWCTCRQRPRCWHLRPRTRCWRCATASSSPTVTSSKAPSRRSPRWRSPPSPPPSPPLGGARRPPGRGRAPRGSPRRHHPLVLRPRSRALLRPSRRTRRRPWIQPRGHPPTRMRPRVRKRSVRRVARRRRPRRPVPTRQSRRLRHARAIPRPRMDHRRRRRRRVAARGGVPVQRRGRGGDDGDDDGVRRRRGGCRRRREDRLRRRRIQRPRARRVHAVLPRLLVFRPVTKHPRMNAIT